MIKRVSFIGGNHSSSEPLTVRELHQMLQDLVDRGQGGVQIAFHARDIPLEGLTWFAPIHLLSVQFSDGKPEVWISDTFDVR